MFYRHILRSSVAVMYQHATMDRSAIVQGLLQGIEHKAGMRGPADALAHDVAGVDVDHEFDVVEPVLG
jgi:hypothetical protein